MYDLFNHNFDIFMLRLFLIVAMGKLTGIQLKEWLSLSDIGSHLSLYIQPNVQIFLHLLFYFSIFIFSFILLLIDWRSVTNSNQLFFFIISNFQYQERGSHKNQCVATYIASWNSPRDKKKWHDVLQLKLIVSNAGNRSNECSLSRKKPNI